MTSPSDIKNPTEIGVEDVKPEIEESSSLPPAPVKRRRGRPAKVKNMNKARDPKKNPWLVFYLSWLKEHPNLTDMPAAVGACRKEYHKLTTAEKRALVSSTVPVSSE